MPSGEAPSPGAWMRMNRAGAPPEGSPMKTEESASFVPGVASNSSSGLEAVVT
jgi:hypothetical protein